MRLFSIWSRAWNLWLTDFWPLLGYCVLVSLMVGVASQLYVPMLFLLYPLCAGCYYLLVRRVRGQSGVIDDLFDGFRRNFGDLTLINLVTLGPVFLLVMAGSVVCFVIFAISMEQLEEPDFLPIAAIFGSMSLFLMVVFGIFAWWGTLAMMVCADSGYRWGTCLKIAGRAVMRHWFKLLLFHVIFFVLSLLGVLALYVGTFFAAAWGMIATAVLYEDLFGEELP